MIVWIFSVAAILAAVVLSTWDEYRWAKRNLKIHGSQILCLALAQKLTIGAMMGVLIIPFGSKPSLLVALVRSHLWQTLLLLVFICCQVLLGIVIRRVISTATRDPTV